MSKSTKQSRPATKPKDRGLPLLILATLSGGAFLGYLTGELALARNAHPIHWLVAAAGGLAGWLIGKLIYRLRGYIDII